MRPAKFFFLFVLVTAAVAAGWFFGHRSHNHDHAAAEAERKIMFYQSPMHPWIKSEKPGNCTICGMKLTPVYEGEKGFDTAADVVTLSTNQVNVINVQTEPASQRPLERRLEVAGRIEPDETRVRVIAAYVDGRIDKLAVNFTGAEVLAGQPLAEIYSPVLLTAQRELNTLLSSTPGTNSARLRDEHQRLIEGTRQRLIRLGLTDEQIAQLNPNSAPTLATQILAPISGTVINKAVVEGRSVKEGDKLFELADLSRMWFRFDVYEQDMPWVRQGQSVKVSIPALGSETFDGTVMFIEPTLSELTRSARVRVELANPIVDHAGPNRRALSNGLYAHGYLVFTSDPVLTVNRRAVLHPGDRPRVYVRHEGAYQQRIVTLGRRGEHLWEILHGIEPGEQIVTEGNLMIDSQAELNRGSNPSEDHHHTTDNPSGDLPPILLSPEQIASAHSLFAALSKTSEALAADKPNQYSDTLPLLQEHFHTSHAAFAGTPLHPFIDKAANYANLSPGTDLEAIRHNFLPFSNAMAAFAIELRKHTPIQQKVFKCPMFPKIGQTAYWLQDQSTTRNPFYGAEMLECGSEVKGAP